MQLGISRISPTSLSILNPGKIKLFFRDSSAVAGSKIVIVQDSSFNGQVYHCKSFVATLGV